MINKMTNNERMALLTVVVTQIFLLDSSFKGKWVKPSFYTIERMYDVEGTFSCPHKCALSPTLAKKILKMKVTK